MDLTPKNKAVIDAKDHYQLLERWRYAPSGDPWFQGETGEYWGERMSELKAASPGRAVADSKAIGWD